MTPKKILKPSPPQIISWVKKHFPDYKAAQNGEQIRVNNPFDNDKGRHLWINVKLGLVHDFRPNHRQVDGTFLWFVKRYRRISFREAVREVIGENVGSENYTYYLPRDAGPRKKVEMPDGFEYLYGSNDILAQPVINYLHTRKVTAEQIQSHKIGYTDLEVVFPFFEDGDIVYWQSRSVIDKKFKFPEGTNKTDFVYGIDNIEPGEPIIMTESIFNALMFDRGVPIGGSSPSPNQKIKLKKRGVSEIIVAFDNDEAGRAGTSQCFKLFRSDFSLCYSMPPDPELDWNDIAQMHGRPAAYESLTKNIKKLTFQESIRLKMK